MSHSLEVRVPYLDLELADLSLSLPDESKFLPPKVADASLPADTYRAMGVKRIIIDVGKPFLPKDFDIQPKRGFGMPFDNWLKGPLKEILLDTLSETRIQNRGWLDLQAVTAIKQDFLDGRVGWFQPWLVLMIELWAEQVLDSLN
jgi:asparagine synthase (glutamine-hydrolysing)